ncbi:sulfotransferase [Actinocorallia sp. B10E7]|uniref:sulfotransferase family protein n=1 Tax=Actinocorallia sp. B10E7 TaxID=3153558 RepID=UPI00325DCADA
MSSENHDPGATYAGPQVSEGRVQGPLLLAGGCPRSGTTLLRTMLNAHPDLAVPHETKFVVHAYRRRDAFGDLRDPERRRDVARWIVGLKLGQYSRIGIPEKELAEAFAAAPPSLGSLIAVCFGLYAEREGKSRWGDKRPSYAYDLNALFQMFPDTKFVNVVRDPRACVLSMRKAWKIYGRLASATEVWDQTYQDVQNVMERFPILEIRYEDLLAEPEKTLLTICEFTGLDTAGVPEMMAYHKGKTPTGYLYENAGKPLDPSKTHKWASELEPEEIAFVERLLADRMKYYGYEPVTPAGARIDKDMMEEYSRLRSERIKERRQRQMVEFKRKFTYRQPVAVIES